MSGFAFKAIGVLVVIGAIFVAGFIVGGGFATDAAKKSDSEQISRCLPIKTVDEANACLQGGDE